MCTAVADVPQPELSARYVATFDRSRRRTLHLTYWGACCPYIVHRSRGTTRPPSPQGGQ
ncbi:hypothetical protein [Streptomyces sp. A1547]|uniref:hypothetical protein n=1 Tax=Streptomyces sp. A1547 TaxID=2563105 RepID=UPI001F0F39D5|nr:hypothetical protein [Streptomyces sp. A1547]